MTNIHTFAQVTPYLPSELKWLTINMDSVFKAYSNDQEVQNYSTVKKFYKLLMEKCLELKIPHLFIKGKRSVKHLLELLFHVSGRNPTKHIRFSKLLLKIPDDFERLYDNCSYHMTIKADLVKAKLYNHVS